MTKHFEEIEDVLSDESFRAWYFNESANAKIAWENWYTQNPQYHSLVQEAVDFMRSLPAETDIPGKEETERRLSALHEAIERRTAPVLPHKKPVVRWWMSAAAAAVVFVLAIVFWQKKTINNHLKTEYAQTSTRVLPDGSSIVLNANSSARMGEGWKEGKDREIWVEGEAFFQVKKTPEKSRFIVHLNNADVIVTGTSFNVLNRGEKNAVFLAEGSVTLSTKEGKTFYLHPGDYVEISGKTIEQKTAKEENVTAWKNHQLYFSQSTMEEFAIAIHDLYGVDVVLKDDALKQTKLTGILDNHTLDEVLNAVGSAMNFEITRSGNTVFIAPKK